MEYLVEDLHTWNQSFAGWGSCGCGKAPPPSVPYSGMSSAEYGGWLADMLEKIKLARAARKAAKVGGAAATFSDAAPGSAEWLAERDFTALLAAEDRAAPELSFWQRLGQRFRGVAAEIDPGTKKEWQSAAAALIPAVLASRRGAGSGPSSADLAELEAMAAAAEAAKKKKQQTTMLLVGGGVVVLGLVAVMASRPRRTGT